MSKPESQALQSETSPVFVACYYFNCSPVYSLISNQHQGQFYKRHFFIIKISTSALHFSLVADSGASPACSVQFCVQIAHSALKSDMEQDSISDCNLQPAHFFEGVEKLLEVWFTRSDGDVGKCDLRLISRYSPSSHNDFYF